MGAEVTDQDELAYLLRAAHRACEEGPSTSDFEAEVAAVVDYIQANPECREAASRLFIEQVQRSAGCIEVLEYCMHELRWPEVEEAVRDHLAASEDWRVKTALAGVLAAFADDWPDADMYERWRATP